jgi:YegS/Rv2252/BmrU family lipid kinase
MSGQAATMSILSESPAIVFVNSVAGGGRAPVYLARIQGLFESFHIQAQFVATNSATELETSAQNSILQGRRTLFAMGGDGTFQALVNAAFGADVLLGVLPSGGGNDFAAALGLPDDPLEAAQAILQGKPRFVDLVKVRTAEGRTRLYAGGGGIGLDAEAARYASGAYRRFPGRSRYIVSALRALAGFVPLEVHIDFPGSDLIPQDTKALLAAVLNTPTYGAGLRLAPGAAVDDGSLHVVLIEDIGTLGVLRLLPRLMGSGELRTSRVKRWQARSVRLTTHKPCLFHGDGEIIGSTPVEIEVVPRAIQVLAPVSRQDTCLSRITPNYGVFLWNTLRRISGQNSFSSFDKPSYKIRKAKVLAFREAVRSDGTW